MDIKAQAEKVFNKIQADPSIASNFTKDPIGCVKKLLGVSLPDDAVKNIVDLVKTKLAGSKVADTVSNIGGSIGGLFGK